MENMDNLKYYYYKDNLTSEFLDKLTENYVKAVRIHDIKIVPCGE